MNAREMTRIDRPYVVNTWGNNASYPGLKRREVFALADKLLDAYPIVRTVCLVTGDTVHAWACGEGERTLHYVYVPDKLRHRGLARRAITLLFGDYPRRIDVTHEWPEARGGRFVYLPDLLAKAA